jgi:hypothetical protein
MTLFEPSSMQAPEPLTINRLFNRVFDRHVFKNPIDRVTLPDRVLGYSIDMVILLIGYLL